MRYKVALFDLDGCITASAPGIIRCIKETLDESGVKYKPEDLNKMIGPPFRESMRLYCGLESEETEQFIIGYRARYNEYGWKNLTEAKALLGPDGYYIRLPKPIPINRR